MSPARDSGVKPDGFSGMIESAARRSRIRSVPTVTCAIAFVVVARSLTGLKNRFKYARYTVKDPTVMTPDRIRAVPRHRTIAVQAATVIVTTGASRALSL